MLDTPPVARKMADPHVRALPMMRDYSSEQFAAFESHWNLRGIALITLGEAFICTMRSRELLEVRR